MQKPLAGQIALVTKGGRGPGRAMAQALAEAGVQDAEQIQQEDLSVSADL